MEEKNFGALYQIVRGLLYPWTSRVRTLNPDLQEVLKLQKEGPTLFVGQGASFIDFLVINQILARHGCEQLSYTHGISPFLVLPFGKAFRVWSSRLMLGREARHQQELDELVGVAASGGHGLVFLKKRAGFMDSQTLFFQGFFGKLADELEKNPRPINLLPTSVFLTRKRKQNAPRSNFDIFFGSYDIPSKARKLLQLLFNHQKGGAIFSKPINMLEEVSRSESPDTKTVDKRLRWTLLFHLNGEDRAYRGPNKRSKERKVRKILKERRLNEELQAVAQRTGRSLESVQREADKNLHEIASDTSERVVNILRIFFDYVWARTLEGIDFKEDDLERVRELSKKGPVVFLPCHRSHVDYLVVGHHFEKQGLHYPRIAAGDNLAKWPLGPILRRAGAFFLRRSFKGEPVFPLVFDAYVRHLLRERHILLFFMEGGRSRTGKLLHPKMGMMSMLLEAWKQGVVEELPLVPVTIDYGKIFEGKSYLREKSGEEKQAENLASVLQSRKVLKAKHGVLRLRFGEPVYLGEFAAARGYNRENLGFKTKIPFLTDLSYHIMGEVNRRVTLTAGNIVAGLLLGNPRRGMAYEELKALFVIAVRYLQHRHVELAFPEKKLELALNNAIQTFIKWETLVKVEVSGEVVVNIPENKRSEMEYYKNNGLHFILDLALFCMGFQCLPQGQRNMENIHDFARQVYQLLSQEFLFRGEYPTREQMEKAYHSLSAIDALKMEADQVCFGDYRIGCDLVRVNAFLLLNFLESYFVVAETLSNIDPEKIPDRKQFLKLCISRAQLLFAVGTLRRNESINNVSFQNAITRFGELGWVNLRSIKNSKQPQVVPKIVDHPTFKAEKDRLFGWIQSLS